MDGIVKLGYVRETPNDTGWFYEVVTADAIDTRVKQLMSDQYIRKISINKAYGDQGGSANGYNSSRG